MLICGRENVSDTAKACPGCGYGIKEHFDKIGRESKQERIEIKVDGKAPVVNRIEPNHRQRQYRMHLARKCKLDSCDNYRRRVLLWAHCSESGCYNCKGYGSDYCIDHQVDMRERLTDSFAKLCRRYWFQFQCKKFNWKRNQICEVWSRIKKCSWRFSSGWNTCAMRLLDIAILAQE